MKRLAGIVGLALALGLSSTVTLLPQVSWGGDAPMVALATQTVEGTVLKVNGDEYLILDNAGKENRVIVDKNTTIIGEISPGDTVQAKVDDKGRATSLKKQG